MEGDKGSLDFKRIRIVLGRSPHFRALPGDRLDTLATLGRIVAFQGGDLIQPAGHPAGRLWLVLKGGVRISMPDARGGVAALAIIGEGSYYSAGAFTAEDVIPTEAVSVGRTDMARFEVGRIRKAFQGDQTIADFLVQLVARRLMATIGSYRDVVAAPLPERLARRLLSHALAAGHTRDEVELRVTQGDLAEMLGAGRGQVAAELRQLESDGAIRLGYRSVRVRDFQRLCEAAGPGVLPF